MSKRTTNQMKADREKLVAYVKNADTTWVRPPAETHTSDVKALVEQGVLRREVRREFDKQRGNYSHAFFGGAGAVQRHRAYIALAEVAETPAPTLPGYLVPDHTPGPASRPRSQRVRVLGPNLSSAGQALGTLHVHAEGCNDIVRRARHWGYDAYNGLRGPGHAFVAESLRDVVEWCYPPGDFEYDPENPDDYAPYRSDVHVFPCVTLAESAPKASTTTFQEDGPDPMTITDWDDGPTHTVNDIQVGDRVGGGEVVGWTQRRHKTDGSTFETDGVDDRKVVVRYPDMECVVIDRSELAPTVTDNVHERNYVWNSNHAFRFDWQGA